MENREHPSACDFCGEALRHWYTVQACRYVGLKVIADFRYRLCHGCYPKVQYAVRQALNTVLMDMLQESWAKLKQDFQAAGKI